MTVLKMNQPTDLDLAEKERDVEKERVRNKKKPDKIIESVRATRDRERERESEAGVFSKMQFPKRFTVYTKVHRVHPFQVN